MSSWLESSTVSWPIVKPAGYAAWPTCRAPEECAQLSRCSAPRTECCLTTLSMTWNNFSVSVVGKSPYHEPSLACAVQLRRNWQFLKSAVRSADRDTHAQRGSLAFRIYAEYNRTSTLQSAVEAALAQPNRLLKDGEETEPERRVSWGPPRKSRVRPSASPKRQ